MPTIGVVDRLVVAKLNPIANNDIAAIVSLTNAHYKFQTDLFEAF